MTFSGEEKDENDTKIFYNANKLVHVSHNRLNFMTIYV